VAAALRITASPDFETKSSYSVRVKTADQDGLSFEKAFNITVTNVNETPTDIALSATSVAENVAANSTIGALSTTDVDASNTFTYTLVAGTGDTDNTAFNISAVAYVSLGVRTLKLNQVILYESKPATKTV
jgi:large repetitive protein